MKKFISGGVWAFSGKLTLALTSLLTNALITRLLPPSEVGTYFLLFSLVSILTIVAQLGLTQSMIRFVAQSMATEHLSRARQAVLLAFRIAAVGALVVSGVLVFGGGHFLAVSFFKLEAADSVMFFVAVWVLLLVFQGLIAEIQRGFHNIRLATIFGGALTGIISTLLFLGVFLIEGSGDLEQIILLSALAGLATVSLSTVALWGRLKDLPQSKCNEISVAEILQVSWPLWLVSLTLFVMLQVDVWVLGLYGSGEDVAIYGSAARMIALLTMPLFIMNAIMPPVIAKMYAQNKNDELERLLREMATIVAVPSLFIAVIFLVFSGEVLAFIYGDYYRQGGGVLALLTLGHLVNIWSGSPGLLLIYAGLERVLLRVSLVSGFLTVTLSVLLVEHWSYMGVAFATMLGVIFHNIMMWSACKSKLGIQTHILSPKDLNKLYLKIRVFLEVKAVNTGRGLCYHLNNTMQSLENILWKLTGKVVVECLGDSHVKALRLLNGEFKHTRFKTVSVEGATVLGILNPNSKTNAMQIFEQSLAQGNSRDHLLFMLGEVDCGFLIWLLSQKREEESSVYYERAVSMYKSFLESQIKLGRKMIVVSAPLPTITDKDREGIVTNLRKEVKASQKERTEMTLKFNQDIRFWCKNNGVEHVNLDAYALDNDTKLVKDEFKNKDKSDHHYDNGIMCKYLMEEFKSKGYL